MTLDIILETKSTPELEYPICSIDWSPKNESEAAFIDYNGYWGIIENIPLRNKNKKPPATSPNKINMNPSLKHETPQVELNEDELSAALFEGEFRKGKIKQLPLLLNNTYI